MERHQIIEMMRELKLAGMRAAFDEILANELKRQHSIPQIMGDLLQAEIAEKQARSIKYQVAIARLPLAKELSDFDFSDTPINEGLVRDLATGSFLQNQRNTVLVGGTVTGKSHLAVAIARACNPRRRPWPLPYRGRPGQPARGRSPRRAAGPYRRSPHPARLPHS
jgi:DNA replication protein DnaC